MYTAKAKQQRRFRRRSGEKKRFLLSGLGRDGEEKIGRRRKNPKRNGRRETVKLSGQELVLIKNLVFISLSPSSSALDHTSKRARETVIHRPKRPRLDSDLPWSWNAFAASQSYEKSTCCARSLTRSLRLYDEKELHNGKVDCGTFLER
jgi:hypothetical protein